jgi:enterochelin esterase-like enzyme
MGLTSALFISLTIALACGSLVGIVWLWPRVSGPGVPGIASRLGLIVVSQLLMIVAFLACLNSYFGFFGSWSSLIGSASPPALPRAGTAIFTRPIEVTGSDLGPVPGGGSVLPVAANGAFATRPPHYYAHTHTSPKQQASSTPGAKNGKPAKGRKGSAGHTGQIGRSGTGPVVRTPATVGKVLQVNIRGERTGIGVTSDFIYLPPQYFQRPYAHARFPVVLALTGYPNDPWSIVRRLALPATAARLVAAHRIKPAIYVMMNVSVALPRDTECTNVPAGPQVETFFAEDVPQAVERTFRAQTGRSGWSVLGYSTGGYCAAKLAMTDPYQYSSAVSLAGYYGAIKDRTTGNIYGGSQAYQNENNLDWRLQHLPAPPVSVLVTSSRVGELDLPGTLTFLRLVHSPMRGYALLLRQGGHNYHTWLRELPQSLEWLNQRLTPAAPTGQSVAVGN